MINISSIDIMQIYALRVFQYFISSEISQKDEQFSKGRKKMKKQSFTFFLVVVIFIWSAPANSATVEYTGSDVTGITK